MISISGNEQAYRGAKKEIAVIGHRQSLYGILQVVNFFVKIFFCPRRVLKRRRGCKPRLPMGGGQAPALRYR